jgi:hypothetical protein
LIVPFGTRRERYDSALQMHCYSGIAPVKEASSKTNGSISGWLARSFYAKRFTSLPATRSDYPSGPGLTTSTCETTKKSPPMPRFALSPTNGFASSFDAGRMVSPTTSPRTCSRCVAGELSSVVLWR